MMSLRDNPREGGTTCHSHEITAIANHNHPINSPWTKWSPTLHFLLLLFCISIFIGIFTFYKKASENDAFRKCICV